MNTPISRRSVLRLIAGSGATIFLQTSLLQTGCAALRVGRSRHSALDQISPINRLIPEPATKAFSGDNPTWPHSILWAKDAFAAGKQAEATSNSEVAPLVIIGGGLSGLLSAYLLREHRPIVLEQAARFGGNSKGESFRDIDYSIGAAYFIKPDEGSPIEKLFNELNLADFTRVRPAANALELEPALQTPERLAQAEKLTAYLEGILSEAVRPFPEIPVLDSSLRSDLNALDRQNFLEHLEQIVGGSLDPVLNNRIEHYCWSSFGASASEISAAAGLNFFASEFGEICVPAGGNAVVAERILERLNGYLPNSNLRTNTLVYDVHDEGPHVRVSYVDLAGVARSVLAKSVIMACPKFVVGKILRDIEPSRLSAIRQMKYRSYLVGNVCLNEKTPSSFYDLYLDSNPTQHTTDARTASAAQQITDVVLANYARDSRQNSVLTLYRALPYEGGRAELFAEDSYARIRSEFETQILRDILPALGLSEGSIQELRLTRRRCPAYSIS